MDIQDIVKQFAIPPFAYKISKFGGGHINDTFKIESKQPDGKSYLLQKINSTVFNNVEGLMNNISIVTKHLHQKLKTTGCDDIDRMSLRLVDCLNGKRYFTDEVSNFWRMFNFIEDHKVYDRAPNAKIAYEGARMYGNFLSILSDLSSTQLIDTIPNFHNLKVRMANLKSAIKNDKVDRLKLVRDDILYIKSMYSEMLSIQRMIDLSEIPMRITHNDTKINNVLFDKNDKGLCVVDLDTVMPGYVHFDFGDGVRTFANTGQEDDEDLSNVSYDLSIFEGFSAGYIEESRNILSGIEISTLAHAALLFPFMMGVRFLTDFLEGDHYYKINYDRHNLVRARSQFKLAKDGTKKFDKMSEIIAAL